MKLRKIDSIVFLLLLIADVIAVVIGMVAGPLKYTGISNGASVAAIIISVAIIVVCRLMKDKY